MSSQVRRLPNFHSAPQYRSVQIEHDGDPAVSRHIWQEIDAASYVFKWMSCFHDTLLLLILPVASSALYRTVLSLLCLSDSDIQGEVRGASCPTAQSRRSPGAGTVSLPRGAAGMGGGGTGKRVRAGRLPVAPVSQGHEHRGMWFSVSGRPIVGIAPTSIEVQVLAAEQRGP